MTDTLHLDFGSIVPMNVSSHSDHDLMVDVAGAVRFTGDILFNGITPLNWAGDFGQSIQACHQSASWEGYFVPGHGAIQHSRQNVGFDSASQSAQSTALAHQLAVSLPLFV